MKIEIELDAYNLLCDKVRSLILYSEFLNKRLKNRRRVFDVETNCIRNETNDLICRTKELEVFLDVLRCELKEQNDSKKHNSSS